MSWPAGRHGTGHFISKPHVEQVRRTKTIAPVAFTSRMPFTQYVFSGVSHCPDDITSRTDQLHTPPST